MGDVKESDWKLFRKRLPGWQESYMEKLIGEYMEILSGEGRASERFWALEERIREDKKCPGVIVHDMRRSTMHYEIARLVRDGVITLDDLDGFSEDVTGYIQRLQ
ncbi:MAG: multidrug transporter [Eggerthellales bacterium]|nr:multidrug transporter [Eggerthellales bacterium]